MKKQVPDTKWKWEKMNGNKSKWEHHKFLNVAVKNEDGQWMGESPKKCNWALY